MNNVVPVVQCASANVQSSCRFRDEMKSRNQLPILLFRTALLIRSRPSGGRTTETFFLYPTVRIALRSHASPEQWQRTWKEYANMSMHFCAYMEVATTEKKNVDDNMMGRVHHRAQMRSQTGVNYIL